jgi:hypothetical protein
MTSWYRDYNAKNDSGGGVRKDDGDAHNSPASRRPNHRFDFEIGYLVKSPCRRCDKRDAFPGCDDSCETLDQIHSMLCDSISCTKHG